MGCALCPNHLAHASVISVQNPILHVDRGAHAALKFSDIRLRQRDPVRLPVDGVELDMREAERLGELIGERRFARAGRSDHGDAHAMFRAIRATMRFQASSCTASACLGRRWRGRKKALAMRVGITALAITAATRLEYCD